MQQGKLDKVIRGVAALLAPALHEGRPLRARLHCLRGGLPDYPFYGARVSVACGKSGLAPLPLDQAQVAERRRRRARALGWKSRATRLAWRLTDLVRALPGI